MAKMTPWFNCVSEPPVNGPMDARYEVICRSPYAPWSKPERWTRSEIADCACRHCEWRGLAQRPDKDE